jgi:hypothetical protein
MMAYINIFVRYRTLRFFIGAARFSKRVPLMHSLFSDDDDLARIGRVAVVATRTAYLRRRCSQVQNRRLYQDGSRTPILCRGNGAVMLYSIRGTIS